VTDPQNPELSTRLEEVIRPTPTEVRRAKRSVMRLLDDGRAHRTAFLVISAAEDLGAPRAVNPVEVLFLEAPDPSRIATDNTTVVFVRGRIAGRCGLAELAEVGLAMPAVDPGGDEPHHDPFGEGDLRIGIGHPGGRFSVLIDAPRPALAQAYIRSPLTEKEPKWYLDPDVFSEELAPLSLDERARRALRESLSAFRRGLYLASAALLGVVSEAAWYAAAEGLGKPGRLEEEVRAERTAKVQELVAAQLRQRGAGSATLPDELLANASLLRELRNYGVHPAKSRDDLERYFAEEECGLLLLRTHNYLVRLAGAVATLASTTDAAESS
jgi:hypothetical protein